MTTQSGNPIPDPNDLLADFADRIQMDDPAKLEFSADKELRGFEETLLRLNHAFPHEEMSDELAKRMQADFGIRKRRLAAQEGANRQTWWGSLFRSPVTLAVATFVIVGVLAFLVPSLTTIGSSISGSAGTQAKPIGIMFTLGVIIIIILALWANRRK
jgi:hypothetical protein